MLNSEDLNQTFALKAAELFIKYCLQKKEEKDIFKMDGEITPEKIVCNLEKAYFKAHAYIRNPK